MQKVLSINIPTYNRARYLRALVDSIGNDLRDLEARVEINIIDNSSTDDTAQIADALTNDFPCIRYQKNEENIGAIANIQKAHRVGTGLYLWVMGDDDYLVHGGLKRIVQSLSLKPAAVLLSYSRVTPTGQKINDVSIGESDAVFTADSAADLVPRVDPLVGFISANIVERAFADEVSDDEYAALDRIGELAHSAIIYKAIGSGRKVIYLAGEPLVQTADNGYLKHDYWVHVCVQYCCEMPKFLHSIGMGGTGVERYFRNRLFKEAYRRVLSEKYRNKQPALVVKNSIVARKLGFRWIVLFVLNFIPGRLVRLVYDSLHLRRA